MVSGAVMMVAPLNSSTGAPAPLPGKKRGRKPKGYVDLDEEDAYLERLAAERAASRGEGGADGEESEPTPTEEDEDGEGGLGKRARKPRFFYEEPRPPSTPYSLQILFSSSNALFV